MGQHPGLQRVVELLAGCSLLALAACQSPGSERIVGPDGSPMAHVHCGSEQGVCFRIAGELCPHGYELKPVLSGSDGNFLVRCRDAGAAAAVAAACPAPVASAPPATASITPAPSPNREKWPPSAEPSAPYPWPAAETRAAAHPQPSAPATQGDVDIGY